jgi:hypothetical protein
MTILLLAVSLHLRMAELVEAGTRGEMSEEQFEQCLKVNDAVNRTLEAERVSTQDDIVFATG